MAATVDPESTTCIPLTAEQLKDLGSNRLTVSLGVAALTGGAYIALITTSHLPASGPHTSDQWALLASDGLLAVASVFFLFALIAAYFVVQQVVSEGDNRERVDQAHKLFEHSHNFMPLGFASVLLALPCIAFQGLPHGPLAIAGAAFVSLVVIGVFVLVRDLLRGVSEAVMAGLNVGQGLALFAIAPLAPFLSLMHNLHLFYRGNGQADS